MQFFNLDTKGREIGDTNETSTSSTNKSEEDYNFDPEFEGKDKNDIPEDHEQLQAKTSCKFKLLQPKRASVFCVVY